MSEPTKIVGDVTVYQGVCEGRELAFVCYVENNAWVVDDRVVDDEGELDDIVMEYRGNDITAAVVRFTLPEINHG